MSPDFKKHPECWNPICLNWAILPGTQSPNMKSAISLSVLGLLGSATVAAKNLPLGLACHHVVCSLELRPIQYYLRVPFPPTQHPLQRPIMTTLWLVVVLLGLL